MIADFRKMAGEAKAAHDQQRREEEQQRAAERDARSKAVGAGVAALERAVLPILERARAAFAEERIQAKISKEFDVENRVSSVKPSLSFRCLGPVRESDGWCFEAPAVFFASDGETIYVGAAKSSYDRGPGEPLGTAPTGDSEALVTKAIKRAIDAYYEELKRSPYLLR